MQRMIACLLILMCASGCKVTKSHVSPPKTFESPPTIDPYVLQQNKAFAIALFDLLISDLRALKTQHEEMGYIDYFATKWDHRAPIFASIEFSNKAVTHYNDKLRFMPGGYSFGMWFYDHEDIRFDNLPIGFAPTGVHDTMWNSRLGIGIARFTSDTPYLNNVYNDGVVPNDIKKAMDETVSWLNGLSDYDRWNHKTGKLAGGIFVVRKPKDGKVTLAFGAQNLVFEEQTLRFAWQSVEWSVDGVRAARQDLGPMEAVVRTHEIRLASQRAMMAPPIEISLKPGTHKITAKFIGEGTAVPTAQATITIENE